MRLIDKLTQSGKQYCAEDLTCFRIPLPAIFRWKTPALKAGTDGVTHLLTMWHVTRTATSESWMKNVRPLPISYDPE